jgi:4-hydroxybenzoate polyprenyltransferase
VGLLVSALLKRELLLFNLIFAGALWFYSHKLSKKPLIGDLSAAVLTVAAFFAVCVYYGFVNKVILIYAVFIVLITLIRELVKDLEGMKGDLVYGYQTLPVVKGVDHTKQWLYGLMLSAFIPFAGLYYLVPLNQLLYYFVACGMALLGCGWLIFKAQQPADYTRVNNLLKLLILSGVASIALM